MVYWCKFKAYTKINVTLVGEYGIDVNRSTTVMFHRPIVSDIPKCIIMHLNHLHVVSKCKIFLK